VFASCGSNNIRIDESLDLSNLANPEEETTVEVSDNAPNAPIEVELDASTAFIDVILSWIGVALSWVTKYLTFGTNNYIITLCIFAIVMEIVFLPFGIKQHQNSIKMAKLKPKEMAIRKKYAGRNDQATMQKLNTEIQELYQKENYNPMSGCFPLLIQFPVLIVLYWVVVNPMKYVLACSDYFIRVMHAVLKAEGHAVTSNGSIQLLNKIVELRTSTENPLTNEVLAKYFTNWEAVAEKIDHIVANPLNFKIGFVDLGLIPEWKFWDFGDNATLWILLLVPVLTFVVYFFSMRINRKLSFQPTQSVDERQQACSNTMMDVTMPLMSVFITFGVPAAIGIYWMFKSLLGVLKQFILTKAIPFPKFTEEDYKAAEKELAGKQPKKIQKSENAGKVRSLHHIDDEDYDEHGNYRPVVKEEQEEATEEKTNDSAMANGTSLKDDSDKSEDTTFRSLFKKKNKKRRQ
jgi:YidC/Oxa1 family membrane protein insertase